MRKLEYSSDTYGKKLAEQRQWLMGLIGAPLACCAGTKGHGLFIAGYGFCDKKRLQKLGFLP